MSRPVDEKIVRMTLENSKFKNRVKETLNSFKAIDDGLNRTGRADLSGIARAVETIQSRFSGLGVVAGTVINRITNAAIDMGKRVFSAFTDPIIEGGKTRALNLEQATFQFQGLGMDVEAAMNSANEAVLGTAFGLDEAAVVAAQFGASGMEAGDEMTEALRGISGVAAMTGGSYADIGRIFTQVAGQGRLMGDQLLQLSGRGINAAATLADAMGVTEQEVREMVTAGEIDFETFANAMSEAFGEHATRANETFSGSMSNLRAALARIGADVWTPNLTNLRDIFNTMTPIVDDLRASLKPLIDDFNIFSKQTTDSVISAIRAIDFERFSELGGMTNLVETFWNVMNFGRDILGAVGEGFSNMFPGGFMDSIVGATESIKNLTDNLRLSGDTTEKLATIFQGVFSVFDSVFFIAVELGKAIFGIVPAGTGSNVLDFVTMIAEMAIAFNESLKEGNALTGIIEGLGSVLGGLGQALKGPIDAIFDFARGIREHLGTAIEWLGELLAPVADWFKEAFGDWGGDEILGGGFLVTIGILATKISGFIDRIVGIGKDFGGIGKSVSRLLDNVGGALKSFQDTVRYDNLMKIAVAVGILAVSLKLLEGMQIADVLKGIGALTGSMAVLALGMLAIEKLDFTGGIRASITILAMAGALLVIAGALKILSTISIAEMGTALLGLAGSMVVLAGGIALISAIGDKMSVSSLSLIGLATAVVILAGAVTILSNIDGGSLTKGILGLAGMLAALAGFLYIVDGAKFGPGSAIGVLGVAAALQIMVSAIERIADLSVMDLAKGLGTIAILLTQIAIFAQVSGGGQMLVAGAGITLIAIALNALMGPVTTMSQMSWEELAKGLVGMAGALLAVSVAGIAAQAGIGGAIAITLMATALTLLMVPIKTFSSMSWTDMLKGFIGLGGAMALVAGASMLLTPAILPMLGFSAALLAIGVAVTLAGAGIALFGIGLTTLATLTATSVTAIVSALGMLIRGLGNIIIDIVNFVVELGIALIGGLEQLVPRLVDAGINIIMALLRGIAENIQGFVEAGYDIVIGLMNGIQEKAPELQMTAAETIVALIEGMSDAISENRTQFVNAVVRLMGEVILVVVEAGVEMIDALFGWIPGVETATAEIGETAEKYIRDNFGAKEAGEDKGNEFDTGLSSTSSTIFATGELLGTEGMDGVNSVDYTPSGVNMVEQLNSGFGGDRFGLLNATGVDLAQSGKDGADSVSLDETGDDLSNELDLGFGSNMDALNSTGIDLSTSGLEGADSVELIGTGDTLGMELDSGFGSNSGNVQTTGTNVANSGKDGAASVSLYGTGYNFGNSFANGLGSTGWYVRQRSAALALTAKNAANSELGIQSPSREMIKTGQFFGDGLGNGIANRIKHVGRKAKELAIEASSKVADFLSALIPEEEDLKIRFILDDNDFNPEDLTPDIPVSFYPDPSFARNMADVVRAENHQNDYKNPRDGDDNSTVENHYRYDISVTAGGVMSRAEVKRLAGQIETEIKNRNDRTRMSRGEEVVF